MAAMTAFVPLTTGVVDAGTAVSASDTIDQATLGSRGVFVEVINGGGSPDVVTINDFGTTAAGNALPSNTFTKSVTNGTSQIFLIRPSQVNPATGQVILLHSFITTVTYKMYSLASV